MAVAAALAEACGVAAPLPGAASPNAPQERAPAAQRSVGAPVRGTFALRTLGGQHLPAVVAATPDRARVVWVVSQSLALGGEGRFEAWTVTRGREGTRTHEDTTHTSGTYRPAARLFSAHAAGPAVELRDGRGATAVLNVYEGGQWLEGEGLPRLRRGTAGYRPYTYARVAP
jgi:hypothetical protein